MVTNRFLQFRTTLLKNKKGSVLDPIFSSAYILKVAATILVCLFVWLSFQTLMSNLITGTAVESTLDSVMDILKNAYLSMDYVFPILVGGLMLISVVFAFKTGTNIVWGILSIIIWAIALILASVFVNVYLSISAEFPTIYVQMPIMDIIMINLHWIVLFWIAIVSAVIFRKNNAEDEASEIQRRAYGK